MPLHEEQTRFQLIDPMLLDHRGWTRADISVEETAAPVDVVYGQGQRRPRGRTDCVLRRPLKPGTDPRARVWTPGGRLIRLTGTTRAAYEDRGEFCGAD
jgi:hypothetical protein